MADEQIRLSETQLELARARYEAGTVARLDVLQAEVQLANARARRIQVPAEVDAAVQAVRTVLSLPQAQPLTLVGTLDEAARFPVARPCELALPSRPDLRAFNARREQAEYASRLANGEWKPSLAFRGNIQYQEDAFSNLLDCDNQNYTFGLAVQMPLMAAPGAAARRVGRAGPEAPGRVRAERLDRPGATGAGDGVDHAAGGGRSGLDAAEGAGTGARERSDRAGVVRERRDHVGRAQ